MKKIIQDFLVDQYKIVLVPLLIFIAVFSICALGPQIAGDSMLYVTSIDVLESGVNPTGFIPMMIVSTYLGLRLIMFLNLFTGDLATSWLILDSILYVLMGIFFYSLLKRFIEDEKIAFLGTLFLATNYAAISFGLAYMMDIGGWLSYIVSLYFCYRYLESGERDNKWIYFSGVSIGIGGLYKEYAFVAFIVLFGVIVWKSWRNWREIFVKVFLVGGLAFGPFFLMNIYTFYSFNGYTYVDWFLHNQGVYAYQNRFVEFLKSFGSIYNFLWVFILGGFYLLIKSYKDASKDKNFLFIWLTLISCFSVLLWPVVTRVLFITAPAMILVSSLFLKKIEKRYFVLPVLFLYILSSYFMDAYILDFINLPF